MKFALAIPCVTADVEENVETVTAMVHQAADEGAELVLFPEAVLTGLVNNDDPAHDLPLGEPIPGPMTQRLSDLAADRRVWLGLGLLERDRGRLYDSAVLFSPAGELVLKYQRVTPGWHGHHADPAIYGHGVSVPFVGTPMGTIAFLICGDLFDDYMVDHVRELAPEWLLLPFARCFSQGTCDQVRWDTQEMGPYAERVRRLGVTTLMVNYLADTSLSNDHSFGGAWVVAGDGRVAAQYPLGQPGVMFGEIDAVDATQGEVGVPRTEDAA